MDRPTGTSGPAGPLIWTAKEFHGGRPVLVLSPHPDDESLACGALLAECFETVGAHVVCVTDGRFSHRNSIIWPGPKLAALRERELLRAISILGGEANDVTFLRYQDCHAPEDEPSQRAAARHLLDLCQMHDIGAVFTPSSRDAHKDHQATFGIARQLHALAPWLRIFVYRLWSRWASDAAPEADARHRLRVHPAAKRISRKAEAIAAHRSQMGAVVTDDPDGFAMPSGFAHFFARSDEYYFEGIR